MFIEQQVGVSFSSSTITTVNLPQISDYTPLFCKSAAWSGGINGGNITVAFVTPTQARFLASATSSAGVTATIVYVKSKLL
jgi:hypothetical protein